MSTSPYFEKISVIKSAASDSFWVGKNLKLIFKFKWEGITLLAEPPEIVVAVITCLNSNPSIMCSSISLSCIKFITSCSIRNHVLFI